MAAYHETHEAPHCPTCDCGAPARDDMSTKPENLDTSGERVYGIDISQAAYDRELIAKMLDELEPIVGLQHIRESVANQARLLRAAHNHDAAGVHTARATPGDAEAVYQIAHEDDLWFDTNLGSFTAHTSSMKRILYTHPAPPVAPLINEGSAMAAIIAAYHTWPPGLRRKLSLLDLRVMTGWVPPAQRAAPPVVVADEMVARAEAAREDTLRKVSAYGSAGIEERYLMDMKAAITAALGKGGG